MVFYLGNILSKNIVKFSDLNTHYITKYNDHIHFFKNFQIHYYRYQLGPFIHLDYVYLSFLELSFFYTGFYSYLFDTPKLFNITYFWYIQFLIFLLMKQNTKLRLLYKKYI